MSFVSFVVKNNKSPQRREGHKENHEEGIVVFCGEKNKSIPLRFLRIFFAAFARDKQFHIQSMCKY
ncbi:MAG: hypothetical protein EA394_07010 [Bacteroidia bacterium]|nr:MAG: hypothetical protein EA394_07010 [Bacteroidia bacterium]